MPFRALGVGWIRSFPAGTGLWCNPSRRSRLCPSRSTGSAAVGEFNPAGGQTWARSTQGCGQPDRREFLALRGSKTRRDSPSERQD